jgi:hypothetical protein
MKSRKMTWAGHVVRMKDVITEHEILFGKAEGKKLLGRQVYRNDTKMYLKEMEKKVERCGLDLFFSGW